MLTTIYTEHFNESDITVAKKLLFDNVVTLYFMFFCFIICHILCIVCMIYGFNKAIRIFESFESKTHYISRIGDTKKSMDVKDMIRVLLEIEIPDALIFCGEKQRTFLL